MATRRKYTRTEPPALLTEPLTITLDDLKLEGFNAYRQARHAWLSYEGDPEEALRLRALMADAADSLMGFIGAAARIALGEPDEYAPADAE
ncbi:hypothetical protein [Pseudomonas sp. NPDC089569]|uniref:hypothetical protein n=1 Tax=Pseudomonas sp. NPDC089569 TaxID=3390722 RepID=UPI003D035348